jgi:hypothetical protein
MWWLSVVRSIPPGRFRVIVLDVAEEIETGLADWVWENPLHFNKTKDQYIKMRGLYWGDVSALWKSILADIASRCETFAFSNHMGTVWTRSGEATDKRKHKGKRVLAELASLYMKLERTKDARGDVAMVPSGITDLAEGCKTRLMTKITRPDGTRMRVGVLPPRLPVATPQAIRDYFAHPAYGNGGLRPEELSPDRQLTAEQRLELERDTAMAQADAERLKLERLREERRNVTPAVTAPATTATAALPSSDGAGQAAAGDGHPPATPGQPVAGPATHDRAPTDPAAPALASADEHAEKAALREKITAVIHKLGLSPEGVQDKVRSLIRDVNDGADAALGRLGPKKLAAILAKLEPTSPPTDDAAGPAKSSVDDGNQTLQEAMAAQEGAAKKAAAELLTARELYHEFLVVNPLPQPGMQEEMWAALKHKFGVNGEAPTAEQEMAMRGFLVTKIREVCAARGLFCAF